jgi:outer membrane protein OmpA-like peptidoglycan-associated protein
LDRDGDGIVDNDDACPDVAGVANEDPALHGCPIARVEKDQIVITQRIEFEFNSAKLVSSSAPVLEAVLSILEEHPELKEVRVEGHTDSQGKAAYNKKLSDKRAASVVKWLVEHGIDRARLKSKGYGLERPIASNDDEVGRQKNRRVEFHIAQRDESAGPAEQDEESDEAAEAESDSDQEQAPSKKAAPAPKKDKSRELGDDLLDDPAMW